MNVPEPKLENLYQEVILDHNRRPRNFKEMPDATQYSHGVNALCGDNYHLYLKTNPAGVIEDVAFQGAGCAISKSSASIMTSLIKGMNLAQANQLKENFLTLMTKDGVPSQVREEAKKLLVFEGVKEFPVRVKCATLIWHALADALKDVKS